MKSMLKIRSIYAIVVVVFLFMAIDRNDAGRVQASTQYETILADFKVPATDNKPWCYWYWINDDISREGITRDLQAMKEAGIGAAFIGNINPPEVNGKVPLFSEQWWDCMVHAVNEGKRLGVDIGVFNCPGWSQSGGPWVKPEMAMRYLTYSQTTLDGPADISQKLVQPKEEFQDLFVLAFPNIDTGKKTLTQDNTVLTVSPAVENTKNWIDSDTSTAALFDIQEKISYSIEFESKEPITARSIIIYPTEQKLLVKCEFFAQAQDGYKLLKSFVFDRSNQAVNVGPITNGPVAIGLPETTASKFKLVCSDFQSQEKQAGFTQIEITERPILEKYIEKQLGKMCPTPRPDWRTYLWDQQQPLAKDLTLRMDQVIDISDKMGKDGLLTWRVPQGKWTVMRIGMAPTGTKNAPAAPQGKGYEIDKANEELVRYHFTQYVGELLKRIPDESRSALKYVIADSYETGSQNWTDGFEKRFQERYGYNPRRWLPVLSGVVVGSIDESERFLWDLRRAVADDIAYKYVGGLKKICNEHNLKMWLENYGHWGFPSEFLIYGGQADLVGGEFWNEQTLGNIECKAASSCVHTYGKRLCFAEAFTSSGQAYKRHPMLLKNRGDWCFTEGVNQFVLHVYIHQPDDGRVPGINAWFATEFNRHNTWFSQSKFWIDYIRRCQHLLQQGQYLADVCYFIGENAPIMTGICQPKLPAGYSYDYINADVILNDMKIKDGRFTLPDNMSYRLMVLPPLDTMRPALVAKLEELVKQGGAVYGPKPAKSPSMQDYPACDQQIKTVADRLWGDEPYEGDLIRQYGKGYVFDGISLEQALDTLETAKDFDLKNDAVLWTHRTTPEMDIYFVSNQSDEKIEIKPAFRIMGKKVQLWDAVTAEVRQLTDYEAKQGQTAVPMTLEPKQSQFVVFTDQSAQGVHPAYEANFPERQKLADLNLTWTVDFLNKQIGPQEKQQFGQLHDWTKDDNEQIKYYSGTAIYTSEFALDKLPENQRIFLNLGQVNVMAQVKINGNFAGGTWIYPYVLDVTDMVKQGSNTIEIEVVNLWRNRLIGDKALPEDKRSTWIIIDDTKKDEALAPSGLIGPISLETIR
jgi:hypothetical protein